MPFGGEMAASYTLMRRGESSTSCQVWRSGSAGELRPSRPTASQQGAEPARAPSGARARLFVMEDALKFLDGDVVEVFRSIRNEWVRGEVLGFKHDARGPSYFIQLEGYAAANTTDPECWYVSSQLRAVPS